MRIDSYRSLSVVSAFVAACSGTTPPPESPPAQAAAARAEPSPATPAGEAPEAPLGFAVVPLRITGPNTSTGGTRTIALAADGTVTADGTTVARIESRRVLSPSGQEIISAGEDGTLTVAGTPPDRQPRLAPNGDVLLRLPNGTESRLVIEADGTVAEHHADGRVERSPAHFDPIRADARGTAALLVLTLFVLPPDAVSSSASMDAAAPADAAAADAAPAGDAGRTTRRRTQR